MKKIFVDTGAWYAIKNKNDPNHPAVCSFFKDLPAAGIVCYTSDYVIDEAVTLAKARLKNHHAAVTLAEELLSEKAARLIYAAPHYLPRALEIYKKFHDQYFSFTDCTSFAIMESLKIEEALAFDRHFNFEAFGFRQYKG
ncbi:MAG: PIN domain-containing protein [Bacillota bacterium]|nr:PIN domain-containing protein [Bacillota bacterium]